MIEVPELARVIPPSNPTRSAESDGSTPPSDRFHQPTTPSRERPLPREVQPDSRGLAPAHRRAYESTAPPLASYASARPGRVWSQESGKGPDGEQGESHEDNVFPSFVPSHRC